MRLGHNSQESKWTSIPSVLTDFSKARSIAPCVDGHVRIVQKSGMAMKDASWKEGKKRTTCFPSWQVKRCCRNDSTNRNDSHKTLTKNNMIQNHEKKQMVRNLISPDHFKNLAVRKCSRHGCLLEISGICADSRQNKNCKGEIQALLDAGLISLSKWPSM